MRYVAFHELGDMPNVIVDGTGNEHTRLTLSHWPHSGTPWELKADLSAQIVFKYLDAPHASIPAEAVSNNHFDEDGLIGVFALLNPGVPRSQREMLVDIAAAGDFGTYQFRDAARVAFVIAAFADPKMTPLSRTVFHRPYPETTAVLYQEMLGRLPEIITHLDRFGEYWKEQDQELNRSEAAIRSGSIRVEEIPALDLAVVTLPESRSTCHTMALHNATRCFRVLLMAGRRYELVFRYETWIQYVSRPVLPRVDLGPLASRLSESEGGDWVFDGVDAIVPRLRLGSAGESRIPPEAFRQSVESYLTHAVPAWNPFDSR
jgi:hypothetical protein